MSRPIGLVSWGRQGASTRLILTSCLLLKERDFPHLVSVAHLNQDLPTLSKMSDGAIQVIVPANRPALFLSPNAAAGAARSTAAFFAQRGCATALVLMPHPWDGFLRRAVHRRNMTFGQVIHDAWPHKGDFWPTRPEIVLRVKKADYVVFLSDHVASALAPYAREWRIAPHPSLALYPEVRSVGRSKRKVLFIGRLLPYKGLDLLLEAWSALDLPGCELLIAGSGRLPKVTIPADVRVINRWLSDYDFELLVSESDLVVLPYREASQSGVIPLALALGKPIVATPVGGLSSQFRNGVEGLISRDLTALSLAQAIRDALLKEWRLGSTKSSNDQFVSAIVPHG